MIAKCLCCQTLRGVRADKRFCGDCASAHEATADGVALASDIIIAALKRRIRLARARLRRASVAVSRGSADYHVMGALDALDLRRPVKRGAR